MICIINLFKINGHTERKMTVTGQDQNVVRGFLEGRSYLYRLCHPDRWTSTIRELFANHTRLFYLKIKIQ